MPDLNDIKLGFSTGAMYQTHSAKEALKLMRSLGYDIVELGFVKLTSTEEAWLNELSELDLQGFRYMSLHAPKFNYGKNDGTYALFEKIRKIDGMRKLDAVVFHPDSVEDFGVFAEAGFNVALENLDHRNQAYKEAGNFDDIFSRTNYKLVLDVNHICSHDPTMELSKGFYTKHKDRITHVHLSGYNGYHYPLFKTRQVEIIKAIQDFSTPIIIESVVSSDELEPERNYILQTISKL